MENGQTDTARLERLARKGDGMSKTGNGAKWSWTKWLAVLGAAASIVGVLWGVAYWVGWVGGRIAGNELGRPAPREQVADESAKGSEPERDEDSVSLPPIWLQLPDGASVSFDEPTQGQECRMGERLSAEGTHTNLTPEHNVWLLLSDGLGNYYMQNPPPRLLENGTWSARNLMPGENIVEILAVVADDRANAEFQRKVRAKEWGAFTNLPKVSREIGSISINVVR